MKRILFLDQYGEMGGGQTMLLSLVRAAKRTGADVTVLAPGGGALETFVRLSARFVPCEEVRLTHGRKGLGDMLALLAHVWRFRRHLKLLRAQDVIYVNGLRLLPHMLLFAPLLRARTLYHLHMRHSRLEKTLLKLAARLPRTFRLVANSRFIAQDFGDDPKLVLVENALPAAFAGLPFTDRFSGTDGWRAAVVGTLRPEKGQDIAIAALPPGMTLHLIGREGDGARHWATGLKQAHPGVRFDGPATDVPAALQAAGTQFALVPSRAPESFGLAAIESMACSCLTIVSGAGGLAEIAERTGALLARDGAALAVLLARLCARPRAELAALARRQFEATQRHYAPQRFDSEMRALLEDALS